MKTTSRRLIVHFMVTSLIFLASNAFAGSGTLEKLPGGICQDQTAGLMWQIGKSKQFLDIDDVKEYVTATTLGDFNDWRLPTTLEGSDLRGVIAIQGNDDCNFSRLDSRYWLVDKKKGTVAAKLELECFCRGDFDLVVKDKGAVRLVRDINPKN